jgi:glyoxylase-like metal-dependent hydrolase (beta-lactamase superfamily II)
MAATVVGEIRIDPVLDGVLRATPSEALIRPGHEDAWAAHADLLDADGLLPLPVGGYLIRTGERVILVDAGLGPLSGDGIEAGQLLDSLAAIGYQPADVTDVLLTHLHFDHVGWVAQKGQIVFEQATYRCHEQDWAHFVTAPDAAEGAKRKLTPIAERLEAFAGDTNIAPGVDTRDAPGHTPGSTIVVVSSGSDRAMLLGDVVHCPFELTESDWEAFFDVDPKLAQRTRTALAKEMANTDIRMAGAHFQGMEFGRLICDSGGPMQWQSG